MKANHDGEKVQTTIGDLVVALSDAAFAMYEDERGAYLLASLALEEILKKASLGATDLGVGSSGKVSSERIIFH